MPRFREKVQQFLEPSFSSGTVDLNSYFSGSQHEPNLSMIAFGLRRSKLYLIALKLGEDWFISAKERLYVSIPQQSGGRHHLQTWKVSPTLIQEQNQARVFTA